LHKDCRFISLVQVGFLFAPSDETIILFEIAIQAYTKLSQKLLTFWQKSNNFTIRWSQIFTSI